MRIPNLVATAILVTLPSLANAAEAPCLTRQEFSGLASFVLPSVMEGAIERCRPYLDEGAYLTISGSKLVDRYEARKVQNWPVAKAAFLKISGETNGKANDLLKILPDDALQDMLDITFEGLASQEIPTDKCGTIDEFTRLLAPLPPENTWEIIRLVVSLAGKPEKDSKAKSPLGKLSICPEPS
jgi:hypothetical protein